MSFLHEDASNPALTVSVWTFCSIHLRITPCGTCRSRRVNVYENTSES